MWKALCVSAGVGIGVISITIVSNRHLSASNGPYPLHERLLSEDKKKGDYQRAAKLFEQGHAEEAFSLLLWNENQFDYVTKEGKQWVDLSVEVSLALHEYGHLMSLYKRFPEAYNSKEQASLALGNAFILSKKLKSYEFLRNKWAGREKHQPEWLMLDVDAQLLQKNREKAISLLEGQALKGSYEVNRLVRLALLYNHENPQASWEYLLQAGEVDPENIDIYTYKARLLESFGKKNSALQEYQAALEIEPNNFFLKDLLGDFYLRNGLYHQAMNVWFEVLENSPLNPTWLKTLFWNKVVTPFNFDWSTVVPPVGKLHSLNQYVMELSPNQYWNEPLFQKVRGGETFLQTEQATFWLRLLQSLKEGDEQSALKLLAANPFIEKSWDAPLERATAQLLVFRQFGELKSHRLPQLAASLQHQEKYGREKSSFFLYLDQLASGKPLDDTEMAALLNSKEAFAMAFLSAGWLEAGLQLYSGGVLPRELPAWVGVAIAEAIYQNRGHEEALKFAMMQPLTPELSSFISELLPQTKSSNSALAALKKMARLSSEVGLKASWMISLIYIERGDLEAAKEAIYAQPLFAEALLGKETLARIAMMENNLVEAESIYRTIEQSSVEAKSYLARKAFLEKDWLQARLYTEELMEIFPESEILQNNLDRIKQEERLSRS